MSLAVVVIIIFLVLLVVAIGIRITVYLRSINDADRVLRSGSPAHHPSDAQIIRDMAEIQRQLGIESATLQHQVEENTRQVSREMSRSMAEMSREMSRSMAEMSRRVHEIDRVLSLVEHERQMRSQLTDGRIDALQIHPEMVANRERMLQALGVTEDMLRSSTSPSYADIEDVLTRAVRELEPKRKTKDTPKPVQSDPKKTKMALLLED